MTLYDFLSSLFNNITIFAYLIRPFITTNKDNFGFIYIKKKNNEFFIKYKNFNMFNIEFIENKENFNTEFVINKNNKYIEYNKKPLKYFRIFIYSDIKNIFNKIIRDLKKENKIIINENNYKLNVNNLYEISFSKYNNILNNINSLILIN